MHPFEAGVSVGYGEGVPVTDMQVARGVGVHGQVVVGLFVVLQVGFVKPQLGPPGLPLGLELLGVVALGAVGGARCRFALDSHGASTICLAEQCCKEKTLTNAVRATRQSAGVLVPRPT